MIGLHNGLRLHKRDVTNIHWNMKGLVLGHTMTKSKVNDAKNEQFTLSHIKISNHSLNGNHLIDQKKFKVNP